MQGILLRLLLLSLFGHLSGGAYIRLDRYHEPEGSPLVTDSKLLSSKTSHHFKIRTITAGVNLKNTSDLSEIESTIGFLQRIFFFMQKTAYEIQTLRIATQ